MINQVSPFSSFTDFFRPIYPSVDTEEALPEENFAFLRESINFFDFGQRGFTLLPKGMDNKLVLAEAEGTQQYWYDIAYRVLQIATIIIPLVRLAGAAIYFLANDFQLQAPQDNLVRHKPVQIEKTTIPVFEMLNNDLITLLFKHLGTPFLFQLGATDKKANALMKRDVSLEKFRVGRDILKQCFGLATIQNIHSGESVKIAQSKLLRCMTGFDLEAAFQRADSNKDLKYKIDDLVAVSEAYAEFDTEKSLEILKHAYSETALADYSTKSFNGRMTLEDRFSWISASVTLIDCFTKVDMRIVNKIFKDLDGKFPHYDWENKFGRLKSELRIYKPLSSLKCRTGESIVEENSNAIYTIHYIGKLFKVLPDKAELLVEDLLEFLDNFIERFPEAKGDRSCRLLDLSEVLVEYDPERACELAELAMIEPESIDFKHYGAYKYFTKYVKILAKNGRIEAMEVANLALELINKIDSNRFQVTCLLDLSEAVMPVSETYAKELIEKAIVKIQEFSCRECNIIDCVEVFELAARVAVLVPNNQEQTFEMLRIALEKIEILQKKTLNESDEKYLRKKLIPKLDLPFKAAAKLNFLRAKKIAEELEDPSVRLIALTAVVEGILSK